MEDSHKEYDHNIIFQVSEMVKVAVDKAIKQLTHAGDPTKHVPGDYSRPARSAEQLIKAQNDQNQDPIPNTTNPADKWIL